ncbi:undecaprenyl-phosphate glucose phosphotransferase [Marinobacterium mangrovicola]|uniref:Putative colanic acid biosynthesis UDP-glucose lipid carrier transferase n=1 Tax=Marinobacterium mangrovicola TaxID=1476959 RepID=A0A4R1GJT2_9GAMM|nr:undecaprenyl-phosphate glucose phosphotransferase [Marinobacterium mangrovicola]TCK07531.1 putative colanic acid biosynthesis UDP-glucose lipid carrier transferase [Marinobacterium mangrovicola]
MENFAGRSLLQRRSPISVMIQAGVDVTVVMLVFWLVATAFDGNFLLNHLIVLLLTLILMALVFDNQGIYRRNRGYLKKSWDLIRSWTVVATISLSIVYLLNILDDIDREMLIAFFGGSILLQMLSHILFRLLSTRIKAESVRVATIGKSSSTASIALKIGNNPWLKEKVVGTYLVDAGPELGSSHGLSEKVITELKESGVSKIYLSLPLKDTHLVDTLYSKLAPYNFDVLWVPDFGSLKLINPSFRELSGSPVISLSETPLLGVHRLKKDLFDRIFAVFALMIFAPVMIATAVAVRLSSPGPVFYRQNRTGWDGRIFQIWKFRSMRVHQPDEGFIQQATKGDPRITSVGRFIRKTSIDELPQLFNVLDGSMSIVGPRPHAIEHDQHYSKKVDAYMDRHRIKPGITGLAQVRGYRGETETDELMRKRVEADVEYINSWSLWLDLEIIFRTVLTLFNKRAY